MYIKKEAEVDLGAAAAAALALVAATLAAEGLSDAQSSSY
jgi:hypothetical protein